MAPSPVLLKTLRDQLTHLDTENQSCPQSTAERVRQPLYSAFSSDACRSRRMRLALATLRGEKGENVPGTRQAGGPLSGPARSQLSWWRAGGRASQGGRGQRRTQGRLGILPPGWTVIPVFSVWLLGSSLLALRECAAALLRLSAALPTAGERCAQHQGAVSDPSSRARTRARTHTLKATLVTDSSADLCRSPRLNVRLC